MVDQLDEEHDEQPLRQKLEETELPGKCLHSERALHIPRAAAVDSNRFLRVLAAAIDRNKSGVNPTKRSSTSRSCFDKGQHKRLKMHVEADGKLLLKGYGPDSFLEALTSRGIVFLAGSSESQVPPAPGRRAGRRRYAGRGQRKISPEGTLSFTGFLLLGDAV